MLIRGQLPRTNMRLKMENVSQTKAEKIIRDHVYASVGVSLIPVPLVDLAGLSVVQLNMLRKLSNLYGIPFIKRRERKKLTSRLAVLASFADDAAFVLIRKTALPAASASLAASLTKVVPGMGHAAGAISMPAISGAFTYAIGKVFNQHFASGETFLTFDPEKVEKYYAEMFEEGKKVAAHIKNRNPKTEIRNKSE